MNTSTSKQELIAVAQELFSEFGYSGVTVRDVASRAGKNVAAINYHFGNKNELYFQVLDYSFELFHSYIESLCSSEKSIESLVGKLFDFCLKHQGTVVSTFRASLGEKNICVEDFKCRYSDKVSFPPGQQSMEKFIGKLAGRSQKSSEVKWAVRGIHSLVLQHILLLSSVCFSVLEQQEPEEMSVEHLRLSLQKYSKILVNSIVQ